MRPAPLIAPGAVLGILGGGQLGRMVALAARPMGYGVHVLDPDPASACKPVVERCVTASLDDVAAAVDLARGVAVMTLEIEKVGLACMRAVAEHVPMRPGAAVLEVVQDRVTQKTWLAEKGFPVGPFRVATTARQLEQALTELGGRCFVKAATGGYDGRGQVEVDGPVGAAAAFSELGGRPCVAELGLSITRELSVMVARSATGELAVFPAAHNHHERRILAWSVLPARLTTKLAARAEELARALATNLGLEGVLAVELFEVDGELLVNELAPRPHNSYHASELACVTSQFEQLVRAVCALPLGDTGVIRPAAICNLLGEDFLGPQPPDIGGALSLAGVRLHLYGKAGARPGRKMGHLSASAATPEAAVELAQEALRRFRRASTGP